ncbi:MAG: hypothetical protein ACE5JX_15415 [Acidobacteriota bacterium]
MSLHQGSNSQIEVCTDSAEITAICSGDPPQPQRLGDGDHCGIYESKVQIGKLPVQIGNTGVALSGQVGDQIETID